MTDWIECLDHTKINLEHNPNVSNELLMFTEERYGSTVVRMNKKAASQLVAKLTAKLSEMK